MKKVLITLAVVVGAIIIGAVLVVRSLIDPEHVRQVLERQASRGGRAPA
jgi:uncharacterized protein involved in outer membrane biogenesis